MAARTSTSIGVGITVTLLGVSTLALFIVAMVFFAQRREALGRADNADKISKEYLSDADRNDAIIARKKDEAAKAHKTVVRLLLEERSAIMSKATGSDRDSLTTITDALDKAKSASLLAALRERDSEIEQLTRRYTDADAARARALQDMENTSRRVTAIDAAMKSTVQSLNADVDKTKAESDALRDDVAKTKAAMQDQVDRVRTDAAAKESALKGEIDKLQASAAVDHQRLRDFEDRQRGSRYAGQSEYALVDAQVVATSAVEGTVTLSIGRKQKVVIGLPFNVYTQGSTIKVDEKTGQYPAGKATVEVIRIDEDSCIARIIREQKGNPVVKGDVVANPIYDPAKQYKFLVYGNFDPSRTGNASVFGANEVKAWIRDWGGTTIDEIAGDVDFIVLGERPQLPPQPPTTAPLEVINFFLNQQKSAAHYDELLKQATDTAIPVLNENRLRTLIGR